MYEWLKRGGLHSKTSCPYEVVRRVNVCTRVHVRLYMQKRARARNLYHFDVLLYEESLSMLLRVNNAPGLFS